jgi:hypothetical protein
MDGKFARRLAAALAMLPLILGVAFASGSTLYFVCRGDAVARLECCCAGEMYGPAAARDAKTLQGACCCDITRARRSEAPAVTFSRDATFTPPKIFAWASQAFHLSVPEPPRVVAFATWALHPPGPSVPILLRKQSFLV